LLICERFEKNVLAALESCPPGTIFLAAVSGGADSMAMLAALSGLPSLTSQISVFHVEHGIRPAEESRGDAEFVRIFCEERKIKYRVKHIPPGKVAAFAQRKGIGIEAAARYFRHKALSAEAVSLSSARLGAAYLGEAHSRAACLRMNTAILIAHTKDDALELSLMRFLRGSGPAGLAAMPQSRGRILRPLLGLTRADVIEYLKAKDIPWREDATNTDEEFLRNRIRNRLIPLLDEAFPSWKTGIAAMAQTQSLAAAFIFSEAGNRIKWDIQKSSISTETENFNTQPLIIREEAIFLAIDELLKDVKNARSVKRAVVRQFCSGLVNAADLGPVRITRDAGKITLSRKEKEFFERGVSFIN